MLDFLLSRDFPGRTDFVRQAETVLTAGSSCSCGCPSFSLVADRAVPPAAIAYADRMITDAHGTDPGGNAVGVMLFADQSLADVEIYGVEGSDFDGLPHPDSLKLSDWSEPDESGTQWLQNP